jgi:hypothetical protein
MSDLMLTGVLRMPMDNPDPLTLRQFVDRARQAADRIEADAKEIDRLTAERDALREQLTLAETVRAAQVAGLMDGLAKLEQDAARYWWLRDVASSSDWEYIGHQLAANTDAEIDASIAALKGEA